MIDLSQYSHRLKFLPEKIWAARGDEKISYPDDGNEVCFGIEDDSFWYEHRNRCLTEAVRRYPPGGCLFDIGGGNGTVAAWLQKAGFETAVVEPGKQGAVNAQARGVRDVIWASLEEAGFLPDVLPSAGLFDVLEHAEDERKLLSEVRRVLKPGGRLYITVPAHTWLWSFNDEQLGHCRRYSLRRLEETVVRAGFDIEYSTYIFTVLPIPILMTRTLPGRLGFRKVITAATKREEHTLNHAFSFRIMTFFHDREIQRIRDNKTMSIGASCLAVANKSRNPS